MYQYSNILNPMIVKCGLASLIIEYRQSVPLAGARFSKAQETFRKAKPLYLKTEICKRLELFYEENNFSYYEYVNKTAL